MIKKNLLIVTSTFPRWKNDTDPPFVFELAKRLTDTFNITVLTPCYPGAQREEIMDGVSVHRFRYFLKNFETLAGSEGILPTLKKNKLLYFLVPFFVLAEFLALWELTRKIKIDVIHAHWILPQGLAAAFVKKITGVPYVITVHGSDIHGIQGTLLSRLKRFVLANGAQVTAVSKDIQKTIKKEFGDNIKTTVLSMGVDAQLFNPDKRDLSIKKRYEISGPFLLYVGRLTKVKGVSFLIEAMPEILKQFPDTKLLIVGKGELQQQLMDQVSSLDLRDAVIFTGPISNDKIPHYLATADIFIGPSIHTEQGEKEGFGLTFVEAGMSECFVVGTNVGGIPDIIDDGKTGFMVREKDPVQISATINLILKKGSEWNHIKKNARNILYSRFDWSVIAKQYIRILNESC